MSDLPTEKQLGFLRKRNYTGPAPSTKQEASDIISKILGDIPQKPFVSLSTGKAFSNLSSYYDCEVQVRDFNYWRNRQIDADSFNDVSVNS